MQLNHTNTPFIKKEFPIIVFCDQLRTPENIGMILRISDAFGVEKIYIHQKSPHPKNRSVKRISRSTLDLVPFEVYQNAEETLGELKAEGYKIIGLEITDTSTSLKKFNLNRDDKLVIIIGAERTGVLSSALDCCDAVLHIPMYGVNSSMNVANSLAIALYDLTNKLL